MGAITDKNKIKKDDKANPDVCMVYYYHKLVSQNNIETICKECKAGKRGCIDCKKELIENMKEYLRPIKERRKYYEDNKELVDNILKNGTNIAKTKAEYTLKKVKKAMKIDYFE